MLPILHKYRYLSNVNLPPSIGIPVCLRYAVWALAASSSPKYSNHQEVFYQRARKYAEADEMKVKSLMSRAPVYIDVFLGSRRAFHNC
jgi:hypothetical protein